MASTTNAFDLLTGSDNLLNSSKKKKKASAKPGAPGTSNDATGTQRSHDAPSFPSGGIVDIGEAIAIFERAAREAKTAGEKAKLWKDWCRQAEDRSGKGLKYRKQDGTLLEFKETLLISKALELTVESCVVGSAPITPEREEGLIHLLRIFLPVAPSFLGKSLVRLSALLGTEIDTQATAQRAVNSLIASLKKSSSSEDSEQDVSATNSWLQRVSYLDQEISKQQTLLDKITQTQRGSLSKEQVSIAKLVYKLTEEKFDLLQPAKVPSSTTKTSLSATKDTAAKNVQELIRVIDSHLQTAVSAEDPTSGRGTFKGSSQQSVMASLKKEGAFLAQQAEQVAGDIRKLEAQLRSLKLQQADIEEKQAQIQQRQRGASDPVTKGQTQAALSAAHYREELAVAESLYNAIDPSISNSSSLQQVQAVQAVCIGVPLEYLSGGQHYLHLACALLREIPGKIAFCKQRLTQADKLVKLGGGSKENAKMKEDAEKLMTETLRGADDLLHNSMQVSTEIHGRADAAMKGTGHASTVPEMIGVVDALMTEIKAYYNEVQYASRGPAVTLTAPASDAQQQTQQFQHTQEYSTPLTTPPPSSVPSSRPFPAVPAPAPASNGSGPKSAFDAAAAYLASARPVSAVQSSSKPEANGMQQASTKGRAPGPVRTPVAESASGVSAVRQGWGTVKAAPQTPSQGEGDDLPTPAEAFTAAAAAPPFGAKGAVSGNGTVGVSEAVGSSEQQGASGGAKKKKANHQKA